MHFVLGLSQIYVGAVLLIIGAYMAKKLPSIALFIKSNVASLNPPLRAVMIIFGVLQIVLGAVVMHRALLALFHAA
jgi:hypothetical protein